MSVGAIGGIAAVLVLYSAVWKFFLWPEIKEVSKWNDQDFRILAYIPLGYIAFVMTMFAVLFCVALVALDGMPPQRYEEPRIEKAL